VASRRRLAVEAQVTAKFLILDAAMSSADTTDDFRVAISSVEGSFEAVNSIDTSSVVPAGVEVGEEVKVGTAVGIGEELGFELGTALGNDEGTAVGYGLGNDDGEAEGTLVGTAEGILEGIDVGVLEG